LEEWWSFIFGVNVVWLGVDAMVCVVDIILSASIALFTNRELSTQFIIGWLYHIIGGHFVLV